MTKSLPLTILGVAALLSGSAALATQTPAAKTTASSTATTKTVATRRTRPAAKATTGRMVTTKTSTGKTITYDCGKAGNATKAACKK